MKALTQKLQHTIWAGSFSLTLFFSPLASNALTVEEVPNPRQLNGGWVTDMAEVLTDETEGELNRMISQLEDKNGTEIAVVTVPETSPSASPKAFATELFNYWGIGKAKEDNGILFLVSLGDRRVEIETGYGIEPILPDAQVQEIIDSKITPQFKQSNFDQGTKAGTQALIVTLESPPLIPREIPTPDVGFSWDNLLGWRFGLALIGGAVTYFVYSSRVFLTPEGKTLLSHNHPFFVCAQSKKPMQRVDKETVNSHLTKAEKIAQQMGGVKYEGWESPNHSKVGNGRGFHLVGRIWQSTCFRECPHCQELTVVRTQKTVKKATRYKRGERLIKDKCHCCDYSLEKKETIPTLSTPSHGYSGGYSGGGGGGSAGGGGSSGGGCSGGGSSGGGGAGGGF
ncbi:MAG: TPM domain-containing protein [Coleofasciculaceae cyanobacterium]